MAYHSTKYAFIFILAFLLFGTFAFSQEVPPAINTNEEQRVEERIENLAQTADENTDFTEITDQLRYFSENPLNLNHASETEVTQLGLLTDFQVKNLFMHIKTHGKLIAVEELQTIEGFDAETITNILPYVQVRESYELNRETFNKILKDGEHTLILRTQRILEKQDGFIAPEEGASPSSYYLGNPWKYYARYRFTSQRKVSFGVTAEKDQGEEFFSGTQGSFDFYSAHLVVRDIGILKTVALGDYQLSYGQGLTVWTGLAFGKSPDVMTAKKNAQGIAPYTSVNESLFKRGAAVSVGSRKLWVDIFYSNKGFDGNLTDTVDEVERFSSFQESGYHRTLTELADKNGIEEEFYGAHAHFKQNNLSLGLTGVHSLFSKNLNPSPEVYNTFYFKGDEITNLGFDYNYLYRNISLFGEVARSNNGSIAYLNGALLSLDQKVSFSVLNRNYPRDYHVLNGNAFAESSTGINERGTFFGMVIKPITKITVSGYFDVFTFPWLRYQVNTPTSGYEYLSQLNFIPNKKLNMYVRFRQTTKPENAYGDITPIDYTENRTQHNYRFDVSNKISKTVTLHNRVEYVTVDKPSMGSESGLLILQDVTYKPMGSPVSFSVRYALFDTDSYESRLYSYENDILYSYSIPAYYYKGSRYYLTLRYKVKKGIDVWLRYAQTAYSNQDIIGSGNDEIEGNKKTEVKMQVRFEF